MKRLAGIFALCIGMAVGASVGSAVQLSPDNSDGVKLDKSPYWNLQLVKSSNTVYKLTDKKNLGLNGLNYGLLGIGANVYSEAADVSLTQGACNTLWGSAANTPAWVYAAYANTQATSVSNTAPSTDIHSGSATTITIGVDGNPTVSVNIGTLTSLTTGSAIATALQTAINAALAAANQGSSVTVAYTSSLYTITSALSGARSAVVVTAGAANDLAAGLKLGVANSGVEKTGFVGTTLCVSNVPSNTTLGSVALGSAGYMSCGKTGLPSTTPVRQIAVNQLNCTGPVIGTVSEGKGSAPVSHAVKYAGIYTTGGGAAAEAITVTGVLATDIVLVTIEQQGSTPRTVLKAVPTANTITVTFSGDPSTDHIIYYAVLRPAGG